MPSTNQEWRSVIDEVAAEVDAAQPAAAIPAGSLTSKSLAKTIDHTLLKLDATEDQVTQLCKEAVQYDFAAVCVRVNFVDHAVKQLQGTQDIKVACVIGFHEGNYSTASKLEESKKAISLGATELDVVLNRTVLESGDYAAVFSELSSIRAIADPSKVVLKLILETSVLARDGVIAASVIAGYAGFDFIKTSTGFLGLGASPELVLLMSKIAEVVGRKLGRERMKVKASGGVRTLEDAKSMLDAGAERIGASAGVAIVKEFLGDEGGNSRGGDGY